MKHLAILWLRILLCVCWVTACQPSGFAQNSVSPASATTAHAAGSSKEPSHRVSIMIAQWTRAKDWTQAYIAKMPEENFSFKPVPEVRSFAEQMLHLAYWNFGFTAKAFGRPLPYQETDLMKDDFKSKARLTKVVAESYDFVISGLKQLPDEQLDQDTTTGSARTVRRIERLNDAYEHQTHHRGQTVVYLRLKGIEPPVEPF
jgi:uncharacterized damage-inducible protein DinB